MMKYIKKEVSIPHRYGKNKALRFSAGGIALFPFLIGTVRTILHLFHVFFINLFPFLIGTVRTIMRYRVFIFVLLFPFLIGTVRTNFIYDEVYQEGSFHSS